jgi:hypothetical protein
MKISTFVGLYYKGLVTPFSLNVLLRNRKVEKGDIDELKAAGLAWTWLWWVLFAEVMVLALSLRFAHGWLHLISFVLMIVGLLSLMSWKTVEGFECYQVPWFWEDIKKDLHYWAHLLEVTERFFLIVSIDDLKACATKVLSEKLEEIHNSDQSNDPEETALLRADYKRYHEAFVKIDLIDILWEEHFELKKKITPIHIDLIDRKYKRCSGCSQLITDPISKFCSRCGKSA